MRISIVTVLLGFLTALPLPVEAQPFHMWSDGFGWSLFDQAGGIALDGDGNVYLAGAFQGAVNFGGGYRISAGERDVFAAKFSGSGAHIWSKSFGDANPDIVYGMAVDGLGNVAVVGGFKGAIDFGAENSAVSAGLVDMFLVVFDPAGNTLWTQFAGGTSSDYGNAVAFDPTDGDVIVAGAFSNTANFGGSNLISAGDSDIFLVRYDASGQHVSSQRFGSTGTDQGNAVATDDAGSVFLGGLFSGTVDFGGGGITSSGGVDMMLAKYSAGAAHLWSNGYGSVGTDIADALATDAGGGVYLAGSFEGTVDFGGIGLVSAGASDVILARFDASGTHIWSQRFGDTDYDRGYAVASNSSGDVVLAGGFRGAVNFGGGALISAGDFDAYVATFDATGAHRSSHRHGVAVQEYVRSAAIDAFGGTVVVGQFITSLDFGGGAIISAGSDDIFVARFADGVATPLITSIVDVGGDEGREVRLSFDRSAHDDVGSPTQVTAYEVYRRDDPSPAASPGGPLRAREGAFTAEGWTWVGSAPAHGELSYSVLAPTIGDSTISGGQYNSTYFVRGATTIPTTFFDSLPDSGYSLDNLAPPAPTNVFINGATMTWDESPVADFTYFTVYGANSNDVSTATPVGQTISPSMDISGSSWAVHFVAATDFAGNESNTSTPYPATGAGAAARPPDLTIRAHPNPFNPSTTISFVVPSTGHVSLYVYDIRGRRIATLIDNTVHPAGTFAAQWNGTGAGGETSASGIYFAQIKHDGVSRSLKIVLLK